MKILTATLVADGTSDRMLLPIVQFLLDEWSPCPHRLLFAEGLHDGPLKNRIPRAMQLYPCDLLFVHRDAEGGAVDAREKEVRDAAEQVEDLPSHICLVPVRMTESWLLLDEHAIRSAAGNPRGATPLQLPAAKAIENLADPKTRLFDALTAASDRTGRRRRKFYPEAARHRVAELLHAPSLRQLPSFNHAEQQIRRFFETYD